MDRLVYAAGKIVVFFVVFCYRSVMLGADVAHDWFAAHSVRQSKRLKLTNRYWIMVYIWRGRFDAGNGTDTVSRPTDQIPVDDLCPSAQACPL